MCVQLAKRLTLLFAIVLSAWCPGTAFGQVTAAGQPGQRMEQEKNISELIDRLALEYVRKPNTHALAIGVLDGRSSAQYFYGHVDAEDRRLPDEHTLFETGAITQTFTATLLASLAIGGQIDLDAPLTVYLPDSVAANPVLRGITLKNLANHTSGLPRLPVSGHNFSRDDLFEFLNDYRPSGDRENGSVTRPGEVYAYSELGFGVIGTILTEITGKTYQELIDEYIGIPLEMTNTTVSPSEEQDLIPVHDQHGAPVDAWSPDALTGSGALKSSIIDLLTYIRAHFESPDMDIEHALAYTRQFTFFDPPDTDIGLAWHIQLMGDNLVYRHQGQTSGSSCFVAFAPDRKKAVIILSNAQEQVDTIGDKLIEALLDER